MRVSVHVYVEWVIQGSEALVCVHGKGGRGVYLLNTGAAEVCVCVSEQTNACLCVRVCH